MNKILALLLLASCSTYGMEESPSLNESQTKFAKIYTQTLQDHNQNSADNRLTNGAASCAIEQCIKNLSPDQRLYQVLSDYTGIDQNVCQIAWNQAVKKFVRKELNQN